MAVCTKKSSSDRVLALAASAAGLELHLYFDPVPSSFSSGQDTLLILSSCS